VHDVSKELQLIPAEALSKDFYTLVETSSEQKTAAKSASAGDGDLSGAPGKATANPHLDQYTQNLTATAKAGKIDPVLGRDRRSGR